MLMELEDLGRVGHSLYSHLGGMNEAVLLDSYVHEGSECRDVCHDARELHPHLQVFNRLDVVVEFKCLGSFARIETRLAELSNDVVYGRKAEISLYILSCLICQNQFLRNVLW